MPANVLSEMEDDTDLRDIEDLEAQDPSIPFISDGVPVYKTRPSVPELSGVPILTDFGKMRPAEPVNIEWCMPDLYRAPEVLLKLPWSFPVDIWSIGIMVSSKHQIVLTV